MKELIKLVEDAYLPYAKEFRQELIIKDLTDELAKTLNYKQCDLLVKLLIARDKLEEYKVHHYIVATHKVCKEAFKLR